MRTASTTSTRCWSGAGSGQGPWRGSSRRATVPLPVAGLLRPTFLVAAASTHAHPSRRAGLTLAPLAELTGLVPDSTFGPDQETEAAASILRRSGVGLVAWEHKRIVDLVAALTGGTVQGPHWSKHRFDMVLVLDRAGRELAPEPSAADAARRRCHDAVALRQGRRRRFEAGGLKPQRNAP